MNVNIDNLEHVLSTLTGFESLSNGDLTSPDSVYAKTVLKLNGVDFKHRAGTEGFVSTVKAGAQKVYEMIKNFLKAIRDFFFGSKGSKQTKTIDDAVKSTKSQLTFLTNVKPVEITGLTQEAMESAKRQLKKVENLLTGKEVLVTFDRYHNFVEKYVSGGSELRLKWHDIERMPGPKITDPDFKYSKLTKIQKEILSLSSEQGNENNTTIYKTVTFLFDSVNPLVKLQKLYQEMRTIATEGLDELTKDLEFNNELARTFANYKDETLNNRGKHIEAFCKLMVQCSNNYTSLIKHCDEQILTIGYAINKLKKWVENN
ncbi:hypothetical protein PQC65_gp139 [Aeromonas phage pAEv1810]|uniref:hypothetical protein n=1 Tax=Aeromonas phage pAEv1810 TaxID=2908744 RepID=UPI0023297D9E|nr:hypothetical protein PQC65_gp139 [Aeromonas phage pAEv1810]UIS25077.1 hypothetical protein pAEv1810_139 [Aeromonas phage pAEv1810]